MFPRYNTRDSITNSMFYEKGIPGYICNFHENGKKMVVVDNEKNITTYLNSWDADGNDVTADTFSNNGLSRNCHQDTACSKQTVNLNTVFGIVIFTM